AYVGMTRAMDQLILTRARYRRRYGTDLPEQSIPSRFLEEVPPHLLEDLNAGTTRTRQTRATEDYAGVTHDFGGAKSFEDRHYSYEDEDQSATSQSRS